MEKRAYVQQFFFLNRTNETLYCLLRKNFCRHLRYLRLFLFLLHVREFLGSMAMSDHLDSRLPYKPLLKAVLLARFEEMGESVRYAQDMHIMFGKEKGIYQLRDKKEGFYTAITHVRLNVSVPKPADFLVTDERWTFKDNHSWLHCSLQGNTYCLKVFQVFTDCHQQRSFEYPRTSLLTELTDQTFSSYKREYEASGGDRARCSSASPTIPQAVGSTSVGGSNVGGGLASDARGLPHGSAVPSFCAARELLSDEGARDQRDTH